MSVFAVAAAVVLGAAAPAPVAPASAAGIVEPATRIPPATIDDTLEVIGESIEAQQLRSRLFIDVEVNGQGPFRFLVDSGADRSVVGIDLAARLALPAENIARVRSMAGSSEVRTVLIEKLKLGNSIVETIIAPALPERYIGAQGIIGIDALADQRILLDFDRRAVTIQDSRTPIVSEPGEIVVTARRRKGQLILTQASVDGDRTYAVIDTGSELTIGNSAMLRRIGQGRGLGRRGVPVRQITLLSVTGESFTADLALLPELRIGGIILRNVQVAFTDAPPFELFGLERQPALLLGTDLLKSFRRLSLDFRFRRVRFTLRR